MLRPPLLGMNACAQALGMNLSEAWQRAVKAFHDNLIETQ
jgi:hypothetical protein